MSKKRKPDREPAKKSVEPGRPGGLYVSSMRASACDIAVSEMTGVAVEDMCGWILVVVDHRMSPAQAPVHECLIMQGCGGQADDKWAADWLERAAVDLRVAE